MARQKKACIEPRLPNRQRVEHVRAAHAAGSALGWDALDPETYFWRRRPSFEDAVRDWMSDKSYGPEAEKQRRASGAKILKALTVGGYEVADLVIDRLHRSGLFAEGARAQRSRRDPPPPEFRVTMELRDLRSILRAFWNPAQFFTQDLLNVRCPWSDSNIRHRLAGVDMVESLALRWGAAVLLNAAVREAFTSLSPADQLRVLSVIERREPYTDGRRGPDKNARHTSLAPLQTTDRLRELRRELRLDRLYDSDTAAIEVLARESGVTPAAIKKRYQRGK
jgi:hypothetical protein